MQLEKLPTQDLLKTVQYHSIEWALLSLQQLFDKEKDASKAMQLHIAMTDLKEILEMLK